MCLDLADVEVARLHITKTRHQINRVHVSVFDFFVDEDLLLRRQPVSAKPSTFRRRSVNCTNTVGAVEQDDAGRDNLAEYLPEAKSTLPVALPTEELENAQLTLRDGFRLTLFNLFLEFLK